MHDLLLDRIFALYLQNLTAKEISEQVSLELTATKRYLRVIKFDQSSGDVSRLARSLHWSLDRTTRALKQVNTLKKRMEHDSDLVGRGLANLRGQLPSILTQELLVGPTVWRSSGILGYRHEARKINADTFTVEYLRTRNINIYSRFEEHFQHVQELRNAVMMFRRHAYPKIKFAIPSANYSLEIVREAVFSWIINRVVESTYTLLIDELKNDSTPVTNVFARGCSQRVELGPWSFEVSGHDIDIDWKSVMAEIVSSVLSDVVTNPGARASLDRVSKSYAVVHKSSSVLGESLDQSFTGRRIPQSLSS